MFNSGLDYDINLLFIDFSTEVNVEDLDSVYEQKTRTYTAKKKKSYLVFLEALTFFPSLPKPVLHFQNRNLNYKKMAKRIYK